MHSQKERQEKAQGMLEYAFVIVIVAAALVTMGTYINRAITAQSRIAHEQLSESLRERNTLPRLAALPPDISTQLSQVIQNVFLGGGGIQSIFDTRAQETDQTFAGENFVNFSSGENEAMASFFNMIGGMNFQNADGVPNNLAQLGNFIQNPPTLSVDLQYAEQQRDNFVNYNSGDGQDNQKAQP